MLWYYYILWYILDIIQVNMSEFSIIDMFLKLHHIVHSARSLCKLDLLRDRRIQNLAKDLR